MSKLKLSEFDRYGIFRLTDDESKKVTRLVQKIGPNQNLSRREGYYPPHNFAPGKCDFGLLCFEYARLNDLLPMKGKAAFVVCESMHEIATRVVNTIQQTHQIHLFQDGEHFDTVAQKCAQECADNLVRLINGETAKKTTNLRDETMIDLNTVLDRTTIEVDNKKQLYMCANALPDDAEHLITPGRGSSKLGTLVQAVRKHKGLKPLGFTQVYYSLYRNNQQGAVFAQTLKNLPEKVLIMDDLIFRGNTLTRMKEELTAQGHQVTNGAINATFAADAYYGKTVFGQDDWAKHIDIIPNQYAEPLEPLALIAAFRNTLPGREPVALRALLNTEHNGQGRHTADYLAMRQAETRARDLGADLYQESAKISAAAVAYNKKLRSQVEKYDTEHHNSSKSI